MREISKQKLFQTPNITPVFLKVFIVCLSLSCLIFVNNAMAAYFIDGNASGCSNGSKSYNPSTRSCNGGSDTVFTSWNSAVKAVPRGSKSNPTKINVRSGTFTRTATISKSWTVWQKYSGDSKKPVFNGNWKLLHKWTGLINIRTDGVTIDGIDFINSGHYPNDKPGTNDSIGHGIDIGDNANYATIKNCKFSKLGGMGVYAHRSDHLTIDNCEFFENQYGKLVGTRGTWGSAIMTSFGCDNVKIRGNLIHGIGGEGLNLNRKGSNYVIENNTVFDCLKPAVFVNGIQNVTVRQNLVYHTGTKRYLNYSAGIIVAAEFWYAESHKFDDAENIEVYDNMVAGTTKPLGISDVWNQKPYNYRARNVQFYNNTVIEPFNGANAFYIKSGSVAGGIVVRDNIFWQQISGSNIASVGSSGVTFKRNLWSKAPQDKARSSSDPRFSSYGRLNMGDYFRKTSGWHKIAPGSLKKSDFTLLSSGKYGFVGGTTLGYSGGGGGGSALVLDDDDLQPPTLSIVKE